MGEVIRDGTAEIIVANAEEIELQPFVVEAVAYATNQGQVAPTVAEVTRPIYVTHSFWSASPGYHTIGSKPLIIEN